MNNSLQAQSSKPKFSQAINTAGYQKLINQTLGDPDRAKRFVAAISSTVAVNPQLQECDAGTILSGALVGEALNLSPSPQLGQYYLVPFNDTKNNRKAAQFILGYKGLCQLAMRSGYYKKLNVLSIKEGELVRFDPLNEEIEVQLIDDETAREKAETIGYYAMFEYLNGFRKAIYWSKDKMVAHAERYSKGYAARKGYTFWEKDFDTMAHKTMLRQLIGHWGIMSTEMQKGYESDMAVIEENGSTSYVDNMPDETPVLEQPAQPADISFNDL